MKKIVPFIILVFLCIFSIKAQTNLKERTVSVSGTAPLEKTISNYRIKATLSMDQVYYADTRMENLEQLKKQYFNALKEQGIDITKFEEKEMEYFSLGYQRDGTVLYYETNSKEIAMKLVKTNLQGVQLQFQVKQFVTPEKNKEALENALKDAMANAALLCKAINTSVGDIISISSNLYKNEDWVSYYTDYQEQFSVSVVYQMK